MALSIFVLFAAEVSSRVVREVRVTKLREDSEIAFHAAEAGFNRVRARLITGAADDPDNDLVAAMEGRVYTLTMPDGTPAGQFRLLKVEKSGSGYEVVSEGTYGSGAFQARRVVAGYIEVTGTTSNGYHTVETVYWP